MLRLNGVGIDDVAWLLAPIIGKHVADFAISATYHLDLQYSFNLEL